ncbi:hypothetical protein KUCAC02_015392 [Chaenocephalus aceratus]|uniref:Uncharacterized protein n=1 Tax=Chaenocephalus aceratus TaxID=36190 RepID=A0ACB9XYN8_CHAAC|nr:hypothetical protein KUCAC02_015392 [Chaenocephalus aceratus]
MVGSGHDVKAASLLDSCTLVEGLLFPAEYYVRTTRRMTQSQSQPNMQAIILSQLSAGRRCSSRGRGGRGSNRDTPNPERSDQHTASVAPCLDSQPAEPNTQSSSEISPIVTSARPTRGRRKKRGRGRGRPQTPRCPLSLDSNQLGLAQKTADNPPATSSPVDSSPSLHEADGSKPSISPVQDVPQPASTTSTDTPPSAGVIVDPSGSASGPLGKMLRLAVSPPALLSPGPTFPVSWLAKWNLLPRRLTTRAEAPAVLLAVTQRGVFHCRSASHPPSESQSPHTAAASHSDLQNVSIKYSQSFTEDPERQSCTTSTVSEPGVQDGAGDCVDQYKKQASILLNTRHTVEPQPHISFADRPVEQVNNDDIGCSDELQIKESSLLLYEEQTVSPGVIHPLEEHVSTHNQTEDKDPMETLSFHCSLQESLEEPSRSRADEQLCNVSEAQESLPYRICMRSLPLKTQGNRLEPDRWEINTSPGRRLLVDACLLRGSSGGLCVAAAGKWAVCLWSQTAASDWSLTHTWAFNEPVIDVFPVPDAAGLMCVTLGQLEIREVRMLSCCSLPAAALSRVVTSSHSASGSSLQVFPLSGSGSTPGPQPLVSPGVCVGALAAVAGLPDALIGSDESGRLFVWNLKTGQLLQRIILGEVYRTWPCLRGYSYCVRVLFVLLQHQLLSSLEEEVKEKDEESKNMALFSLVAINPMNGKSTLATRLYPPNAWSGRLCEADVSGSSVVGLSQSGCVCVWQLWPRGPSRILPAPESEGWQLARWGGEGTLLTGHHNGDVTLHCYSQTSLYHQ